MNIFQMDYYKTYYFANICNAVMEDTFSYVRTLNDFWGDGRFSYFLKPFQKNSVLHQYIEFCIDRLFYENNKDYSELKLEDAKKIKFWINETLEYHNIIHPSFSDWYKNNNTSIFVEDLVIEYLEFIEYSSFYTKLKEQMIEETFFILFLNRKFLRAFNQNLSGIFEVQIYDEFEETSLELINKKGKLYRKTIPSWAKKAVFYRDRGTCSYCGKDLSGLIKISNSYHIDHIVPLAKFGLNDISNLQLLCDTCNTSKGSRHSNVSIEYEKWY